MLRIHDFVSRASEARPGIPRPDLRPWVPTTGSPRCKHRGMPLAGTAEGTGARSEGPRTAVYFLDLSTLNISRPSAGLRFSCTTAWTALIIAWGASDWKMLRPMSTPAAPCWTAL